MNFDEVGRIWREEVTGEFRRTRIEDLSTARDRAAKLDAEAQRKWWAGTFMAFVVVPVYTVSVIFVITRGYLVAALGQSILTISIVIWAIEWRKLRGAAPDPTLPVSAAVEAQVARLLAWERYMNTLGRFLAPFAVGYLLVMAGLSVTMTGDPVSLGFRVRASVFTIVLCLIVVFSNRRRARLEVRPLREDLQSWLADLRDSDLEEAPDTY